MLYNGKVVKVRHPAGAKKLGIQMWYQEVEMALVPTLTVAENVMFNDTVMNMKGKLFMNYGRIRKEAAEVLKRLNVDIDVRRPCGSLTLAQQQMVLIARAIQHTCNFLLPDDPTAPLSDSETEELFRVVRHLRETENIAIIFITTASRRCWDLRLLPRDEKRRDRGYHPHHPRDAHHGDRRHDAGPFL